MSTEKKETESKTQKIERLARVEHSDFRYLTSGNVEGSTSTNEYAVATDQGLFFYLFKKNELTPLTHVLWEDVREIRVDYKAMRTDLTLNGQNYRLVNEGKKIFTLAAEKSDANIEKVDRKWHQKILGFRSGTNWKKGVAIIGYLFLFGFIGSFFIDEEEASSTTENAAPAEVATKETSAPEKEAEAKEVEAKEKEAQVKRVEDAIAKEEKERNKKDAKAEAAQKSAAEKEYYAAEIQPKVDTQMGMYDEAWDTLWVPTFNGISDGSMDVYTAYENMKQLEQRYETLQSSIPAIPDEKLSKENKKTFSEYRDQMSTAAMLRASAAKKAQDMFDKGDYSPSSMDEVKVDIESADSQMLSAIVSLTSLEMKLGIERAE